MVVGKTNDQGTFVEDQPYDIGHLFHTWFKAMGVPPDKMEYDNQGQPLPVAHDDCGPMGELLAQALRSYSMDDTTLLSEFEPKPTKTGHRI